MFTRFATILISGLVGTLGLSADTHADTNGAGVTVKGYYPADTACLQSWDYGAIRNMCPNSVSVFAVLSPPQGWARRTYVDLFGNNSSCETSSLGYLGLPIERSSTAHSVSGPQSWQVLETGNRNVYASTPVMFSCQLEGGGVIGGFHVQ